MVVVGLGTTQFPPHASPHFLIISTVGQPPTTYIIIISSSFGLSPSGTVATTTIAVSIRGSWAGVEIDEIVRGRPIVSWLEVGFVA